jgi:hypothetical protein
MDQIAQADNPETWRPFHVSFAAFAESFASFAV